MTDILLWFVAILAVVTTAVLLRISGRVGESQRRMDEVSENLARIAARLEKLETHIDEYWRGVETHVGRIQDTFESGRACRMGDTVADVNLKMRQLNGKMDELLERVSRSGKGTEAP